MAVLLAIAVTAIVVGTTASLVTWRVVRSSLAQTIAGRDGFDPLAEHRRVVGQLEARERDAVDLAELLRCSLDALTSGVVVTDAAGRPIARNRQAVEVSTRAHERALVDAATSQLLATAVKGKHAETEIDLSGPPSRRLFVHAVPIVEDGRTFGALAVIDDVTDHHRIEQTRRDFVANLSHELRTPVGALSLLAELVVDEDDPETRAQLSERLIVETDRMNVTINDLLELSRIESETESFDERFAIQGLLDEAVSRTKVAAEAAAVWVEALAPAESIEVRGNRDQLLSAMVNLVDNAIKYSEADDSVGVRARADGDRVWITVQDTGRGIPARDVDRIFERFYRVDRSRHSKTGGSGIGLSIVRHVAMNHGGAVTVNSFEGEGSTFTLELPIVVAQPSETPEPDTTDTPT